MDTQLLNDVAGATDVLAAMITPALLISASGTLVLSTSNRLSRVVDRVRVLTRDAENLEDAPHDKRTDEKRFLIANQLTALTKRALLLRTALAALYSAIGLLVATSVSAGVLTMLKLRWVLPPTLLAISGSCALLWGSLLLVREGRLAIGSTLGEMSYVREIIHRNEPH
ncbi:MAG: DUF2721 domain-containing protein [Myxococcales bacterium]